MLVGALMERHTKVLHCEHRVGLNNFTRLVLDADSATIQVSEDEIKASECLNECDLLLHEEICPLSLE